MQTIKFLFFTGLGAAGVLFLTSAKARQMRQDVESNTRLWKSQLRRIGRRAANTLSDLRLLLSSEIEGLSDDTRQRIVNILNGTAQATAKVRKSTNGHLA
jgi:hypothetical protein